MTLGRQLKALDVMNNSRLWLIITQVFKKEDVDEDKGEDEDQVETKGKKKKE